MSWTSRQGVNVLVRQYAAFIFCENSNKHLQTDLHLPHSRTTIAHEDAFVEALPAVIQIVAPASALPVFDACQHGDRPAIKPAH